MGQPGRHICENWWINRLWINDYKGLYLKMTPIIQLSDISSYSSITSLKLKCWEKQRGKKFKCSTCHCGWDESFSFIIVQPGQRFKIAALQSHGGFYCPGTMNLVWDWLKSVISWIDLMVDWYFKLPIESTTMRAALWKYATVSMLTFSQWHGNILMLW